MLRGLSFRQIEAFRAVVLRGSISGGANYLGLTQPAVSRLIRDLESRLELKLFTRRGNAIHINPEAHALFREVERHFLGLEKIEKAAEHIRHAKIGRLHIAAYTGASTRFFPHLVGRYLDQFPMANVVLHNTTSPLVIEGVSTGRYDLGLALTPSAYPGIEAEPLTGLNAVAVVPVDHHLVERDCITIDDLCDSPLLSLGMNSPVWGQFSGLLQSMRVKPRVLFEATVSESLCTLAGLGKGIAIIDPFTPFGLNNPDIVIKAFRPTLEYPVSLIYQAKSARSGVVKAFARLVREGLAELPFQNHLRAAYGRDESL